MIWTKLISVTSITSRFEWKLDNSSYVCKIKIRGGSSSSTQYALPFCFFTRDKKERDGSVCQLVFTKMSRLRSLLVTAYAEGALVVLDVLGPIQSDLHAPAVEPHATTVAAYPEIFVWLAHARRFILPTNNAKGILVVFVFLHFIIDIPLIHFVW